jgi:hypothetical protein
MAAVAVVREADLPELLPLLRAYCDFYDAQPGDRELLRMSRALIADPEREGLQLIARDVTGEVIGFATIFWTWSTLSALRIAVMNDLLADPRQDRARMDDDRPVGQLERRKLRRSGRFA